MDSTTEKQTSNNGQWNLKSKLKKLLKSGARYYQFFIS